MYYLEVASFEKLIKKLNKHPLKKDILLDIQELETNPSKGKYLKNQEMYELRYLNLRFYYIVIEEMIIIMDETYEGILLSKIKEIKTNKKDN